MTPTANRMPPRLVGRHPAIAVIGAGMAGSTCAAGLARAGFDTVLFDKARGVGGRLATRRARWTDAAGIERSVEFDHGTPYFGAQRARFHAALAGAGTAGCVVPWRQRVHAVFPAPPLRCEWLPVPNMPALCRHLAAGVPLRLEHAVRRLQAHGASWRLELADGTLAGPFGQVVLAMPPAQAAALLEGHQDGWSDMLASTRMTACWTLMAVTDDLDWPWDAAEPERGPIGRVVRNDRKPGRAAVPGFASWVAHATPAWSAAHLEDDPATIATALRAAMEALMPRTDRPAWLYTAVHRWRYALPTRTSAGRRECLWDGRLGLGVCGDSFGDGTVESAWLSGDALAEKIAGGSDAELPVAADPRPLAALDRRSIHH